MIMASIGSDNQPEADLWQVWVCDIIRLENE
jgi:hypothetical protein